MTTRQDIIAQASFLLENNSTVRESAKAFGVSKTTLHLNVTERLKDVDIVLYRKVRKILEKNKQERSIRGGMATKARYKKI